ncbi:unnamed protein product [Lactuca saligna]|uniref:Uncharacterized protein n=1 Tax=Lactuca saligna TaxID=75948 RepID=A0AA35ZHK4_LACSI|nr:unnamed protein product [Lactuca saligna]
MTWGFLLIGQRKEDANGRGRTRSQLRRKTRRLRGLMAVVISRRRWSPSDDRRGRRDGKGEATRLLCLTEPKEGMDEQKAATPMMVKSRREGSIGEKERQRPQLVAFVAFCSGGRGWRWWEATVKTIAATGNGRRENEGETAPKKKKEEKNKGRMKWKI